MDLREKPFFLNEREEAWVYETAGQMTLEEKVGQLFCILGDAYDETKRCQLVREKGIGAVLFRPDKAEKISEKFLQLEACSKYPMLKAANLEEGSSGILTDGTFFGSQMQVAAADDPEHTRHFATVCAVEAARAGVNWTFSPVVDIDCNYQNPITNVRTFGSDARKVAEHASIYAATLQSWGMAAACKHFPGDGVDYRDQHLHPTYNTLSAQDWYESYGRIYKQLIHEGILSIMAGHIVQPDVIRDINPRAGKQDLLPGSLSPELLTGVLREKYGFEGVIITDATIMGGYTMAMRRRDAIPKSIMAGCDMLCFSTDIDEDYEFLLDAVGDGRLTMERLDEAVKRILALKARVNRPKILPQIDALQWQRDCARASVTLVKDTMGLLPVSAKCYPRIKLVVLGKDEIPEGTVSGEFTRLLQEKGFQVSLYHPLEDDLHGTSDLDQGQITLIVVNLPPESNKTAVRIFWCQKHALEIPRFVNEEKTIFVSLANPYHLQDIPRVPVCINGYSATGAVIGAVTDGIIGEMEFQGKSPVDPFCGLADTRL